MACRPRVLVLHCPAGGGHRAAAEALAEHAAHVGGTAEVLDALSCTPRWFAQGFVQTHLASSEHAPWLYGMGYQGLNQRHPALDRLRSRVDAALGARLLREVRARRPDVVIGTHFFPLSVLGRARLRGRLDAPLAGVVTDFAAHAFWAEPGVDRYFTTAGGAALDLERHGIPRSHIHETGIPVRPAFAAIPALEAQAFAGAVRVLLTSGGFGIGPLETVLTSFAGLPQFELTVVCGRSEARRERAAAAARAAGVRARILGYESDMPARLADAHAVVGKAGGLTVSESLACGRPMLLVGTCPGQERHNEEWLCLNGAAVALAPERVGPALEALRAAGQLPAMAAAARRLGRPAAAVDILRTSLSELLRCAA